MVTSMDPNTLLESSLFSLRANISFQKMIGSDLPLGFFSLHKIFPETATRDPIMVWLEIVLSHAGVDNAKASPLYSFLLKEAGLGETLLDSSLQDVCYIYVAYLIYIYIYRMLLEKNLQSWNSLDFIYIYICKLF